MKSTIRSHILLNISLFKITIIIKRYLYGVFLLLPAVSLSKGGGGASQNNIFEESHDCSADEPRNRNRDKPRDEDVPEQPPVH